MTEVASLVLFANDASRTADFYRAAGVPLAEESHDDGPLHWAADLAGVHVAVYAAADTGTAPGLRGAASTFPGLYVDSLDETRTALEAIASPILEEHQVRPWGCRFIGEDPDGRAIEINQRSHCARPPSAVVADTVEQESIPLGSSSVTVLATREATYGSFSLLRWTLGEGSCGPDTHFHQSIDEWFLIESGELQFFDGHRWRQLGPGDLAVAPAGGVHAIRKHNDRPASVLMLVRPGGREDYFRELSSVLHAGDAGPGDRMSTLHTRHDNHFTATPAMTEPRAGARRSQS